MDGLYVTLAEHLLEGGVISEAVERVVTMRRAVARTVLDSHGPFAVRELQRTGRVDARNAAVDNERDAVAQLVGRDHVVRGEEDRCTGVTLGLNEVLDALLINRVESARRFVEKNQIRVVQQTPGNTQTAFHALRVLAHTPVAVAFEGNGFEHCFGRTRRAVVQRREIPQVLDPGELEKMVGSLERDADPLVVVGGPGRDLLVADAHEPAVVFEETDQNFLCRGLTGAARPEEAEDLAAFDGERQSTHSRFGRARVGEMEVVNVDQTREAFRNGLQQLLRQHTLSHDFGPGN